MSTSMMYVSSNPHVERQHKSLTGLAAVQEVPMVAVGTCIYFKQYNVSSTGSATVRSKCNAKVAFVYRTRVTQTSSN